MIYLVSNQSLLPNELYQQCSIEYCIAELFKLTTISGDTETTGMFPQKGDKLLTIQLGNKIDQYVLDCKNLTVEQLKLLQPLLQDKSKLFLFHNAKFDIRFFYSVGLYFNENIWCTYLAECVLYNGDKLVRKGLDKVSKRYLNIEVSKEDRGLIHRQGLTNRVIIYCTTDILYLEEIKDIQVKLATEKDVLQAILLDNLFVEVLAYIEHCGIKLDVNRWKAKMLKDRTELNNSLIELNYYVLNNKHTKFIDFTLFDTVCNVDWNSPKEVIKYFKFLGIDTQVTDKKTGKEKDSVESAHISKFKHEFIPIYLKYKEKQKLVSTYGNNFLTQLHNGRIYTSFNQLMDTGRTSCGGKQKDKDTLDKDAKAKKTNYRVKRKFNNIEEDKSLINLQNLPRDAETRACFIPGEGNLFVNADYDSQEVRVFTNFCQDKNMINMFLSGYNDAHSYNAWHIFKDLQVKYPEISIEVLNKIKKESPKQRYLAKTGIFSIQFGGSGSTVSRNCDIPLDEGKEFERNYFKAYPGVKKYFDKVEALAHKQNYITFNNVTRRKYFIFKGLPDYKIKNYSRNYPVQGE